MHRVAARCFLLQFSCRPVTRCPRMIIPMLVCRDAAAEIGFCKRAFGAVEISRRTAEDGTVIWGDCVARIIDPSGHVWNIAARIKSE